jgi:nitroreductase
MNLKLVIPKYVPQLMSVLLVPVYFYDWCRYVRYSGVAGLKGVNKLLGRIVADYHVLEKGLTMADTRLGFGRDRVIGLIGYCNQFIGTYGYCDGQVKHAVSIIMEYKYFHEKANYELDQELLSEINGFVLLHEDIVASQQQILTKEDYFKDVTKDFKSFSNSRRSMRNYSKTDVDLDLIKQAIKLARNAPSVCNRQSVRVHVFSNKKTVQDMLRVQAGNRGFGHLANKVIVVTAELGAMHGLYERNQSFVDGGMWAMNLLYALHYYKIVACPLNCSNSPEKDKLLRMYGKINKSETFIMLISVGYAADSFKIASSPRKSLEEIATFCED